MPYSQTKQWVVVVVDDLLPCYKGTTRPRYMKPNGVELWAVILEKAFAKHCGSYAALSGGFSAWAWQALTGDHVFTLDKTKASRKAGATPRFERLNFKAVVDPAGKDKRKCKWYKSGEEFGADEAWVLLRRYTRSKSLLSASFCKVRRPSRANGSDPPTLTVAIVFHTWPHLQ